MVHVHVHVYVILLAHRKHVANLKSDPQGFCTGVATVLYYMYNKFKLVPFRFQLAVHCIYMYMYIVLIVKCKFSWWHSHRPELPTRHKSQSQHSLWLQHAPSSKGAFYCSKNVKSWPLCCWVVDFYTGILPHCWKMYKAWIFTY